MFVFGILRIKSEEWIKDFHWGEKKKKKKKKKSLPCICL